MQNIAAGTEIATVGTFYTAKVVASEITERGARKVTFVWDCDVPAAGVRKGEQGVWVTTPRTQVPRFVITARA